MSDPVLNQTAEYLAIGESGNFFSPVQAQGMPSDQKSTGPVQAQGLTVEEAAKYLGITTHAVLKRLRKGNMRGFKVRGSFGEKWLVDISEVSGTAQSMPSAGPDVVLVQAQGMHFDPHSTGPGHAHQLNDYLRTIEEMVGKLEGANYRVGYLESKLEERDNQLKLLPDLEAQAKRADEQEQEIKKLKESQAELAYYKQTWWYRLWHMFQGKSDR